MACTLVTAYYPIQSKGSKNTYLTWAKNYMRLEAPIVLFTSPELETIFKIMRGNKPIYIITTPFEELDMWKLYKSVWKAQHTLDPEKRHHSPELYAIWAQKSGFVRDAWLLNPFNTEYFFWCDIGAFRGPLPESVRCTFPMVKHLPDDRLLMSSVRQFKGECIGDQLVGGLWGGSGTGCYRWHLAYCNMLSKYIHRRQFAGKDQTVMLSTYLADTSLAYIVCPGDDVTVNDLCQYNIFLEKIQVNSWFFLQILLSDTGVKYQIDTSYKA
jgi:hypothetical protein